MCTAGRFQYGHNKESHSSSGDCARIPTPHVRMDVIEATSQSMVLASGVPWDAKMVWYHSDYIYIYIHLFVYLFFVADSYEIYECDPEEDRIIRRRGYGFSTVYDSV